MRTHRYVLFGIGNSALALGAVVGMGLALGCQRKQPEPVPTSAQSVSETATSGTPSAAKPAAPAPSAAPAGAAPGAAAPLAVTWTDPPGWERVPAKSAMRAAEYRVPPVDGDSDPGEVTVFYFGPKMGGSVEDNLNRWAKQFQGVEESAIKRSTRSVNGLTHHLIEIDKGDFAGMSMMGGPSTAKPNYGLIGTIAEAPSGNYFFKLTGPSKTVAANKAAFDALIESMKSK